MHTPHSQSCQESELIQEHVTHTRYSSDSSQSFLRLLTTVGLGITVNLCFTDAAAEGQRGDLTFPRLCSSYEWWDRNSVPVPFDSVAPGLNAALYGNQIGGCQSYKK